MPKAKAETQVALKGKDSLLDWEKAVAGQAIDIYRLTVDVLKKGIVSGAANVPLSLQSLQTFADFLHGGAYAAPSWTLPYYNPGVQAQINWAENPVNKALGYILSVTTAIDITPAYEVVGNPLGGTSVNVSHPHPTWISLPTGAKPEQIEVIVNSAAKHVFPKFLSDQQYYLLKEWDSIFFDVALLTGISTNIRTLVQAGETVVGSVRGESGEAEFKRLMEAFQEAASSE